MPVDKSARRVREMFGEIAGRYDLLNHLLSLGIDRWWRRRTVRLVPPAPGAPVLDVCTGTADLALAYWQAGAGRVAVVGADFCRPMLAIARQKVVRAGASRWVFLVEADAQHLPLADDTFGVVGVAFGLRNVQDPDAALGEMARVCRPGGKVAVLEFAMPRSRLVRAVYGWYFRHVLPRVGQALARNRQAAYHYLPASVGEFPQGEGLCERLAAAGLKQPACHWLTWGIAALYVGTK